MSGSTFSELTKKKPEKKLLRPNPKTAGRNVHGKITMRRRGGGAKRNYRIIGYSRSRLP
jgi:large subunit ribosomal protein L2